MLCYIYVQCLAGDIKPVSAAALAVHEPTTGSLALVDAPGVLVHVEVVVALDFDIDADVEGADAERVTVGRSGGKSDGEAPDISAVALRSHDGEADVLAQQHLAAFLGVDDRGGAVGGTIALVVSVLASLVASDDGRAATGGDVHGGGGADVNPGFVATGAASVEVDVVSAAGELQDPTVARVQIALAEALSGVATGLRSVVSIGASQSALVEVVARAVTVAVEVAGAQLG